MSGTRSPKRRGPAIRRIVLLSHGVGGGPGIAACCHAQSLADRFADAEIAVGCLRGSPTIEQATRRVDADDVIVPLLMARGYIHAAIEERVPAHRRGCIAPPLGEHSGLPAIVRQRALELAGNAARTTLLLIGHGTTRHQGADKTVLTHARLARRWGFATTLVAFLDAPPYLGEVVTALVGRPVVAIGYFIDPGPHGVDDVQECLSPLGPDAAYSGPIGSLPAMAQLIAESVDRHRTSAFA